MAKLSDAYMVIVVAQQYLLFRTELMPLDFRA